MATATTTRSLPDLEGASFVQAKLHRAWHKERRFQHLRGLCYFLLWATALVLVDLLVDWLFLIPGYGRLALLAFNAGAIGWVVYHHWMRYLRGYDPVRTALQVERRHPELQSLLVSFVQLGGEAQAPAHASPSLIRALRRQTIEYTRPLDFREIVSYRELKRIAVVSACVLLFFAAISINWSGYLRVLFYRMLNPEARLGYPTRTHIDEIRCAASVQQGSKVPVRVLASGLLPREGTLHVKPEKGTWEKIVLPRTQRQGEYAYEFPEVYQSFRYRIRIGDASTEEREVAVIPPPRIVATQVRLRYPTYTGLAERSVDILNLEVPEGTTIAWELHCDLPLGSAEMLKDEDPDNPLAMILDTTGKVARIELEASQSFAYQFRWIERDHGYRYNEDVHYFIQVIPDTAPQVEILRPLEDEKATVKKTLAILFQARDDYGLGQAAIRYALNTGEEQTHPIGDVTGRLVEKEIAWKLQDSAPTLKEGDVITYAIEVADNYSGEGGPFRSKSQTRTLYIVSLDEYLRYMEERRRKLIGEIRDLHKQETDAAEKVGEIKTQKPE